MNKHLNSVFLKELIDSEFIFLTTTAGRKSANMFSQCFKFASDSNYNILDVFQLNKSLKQFVRILYFLQINKKFKIYIWSSNKYLIGLTNTFLKKFSLESFIVCSTAFSGFRASSCDTNFLFILGNPFLRKENYLIYNRIMSENVLLINKLNFKQEKNNLGIYKIQNDLHDYKKLFFLLVMMHNILIKSK